MIQFADSLTRRRQRVAAAIRVITVRVSGTERLLDETYLEIAEEFDVSERELQREWVRIHWGGS